MASLKKVMYCPQPWQSFTLFVIKLVWEKKEVEGGEEHYTVRDGPRPEALSSEVKTTEKKVTT